MWKFSNSTEACFHILSYKKKTIPSLFFNLNHPDPTIYFIIMTNNGIKEALHNWPSIVSKYHQADSRKAITQLINTFIPFLAIWVLMYYSLDWSYWITLGLSFINGFLLGRIFIIQHDCGHNSFLKNRKHNKIIGTVCSLFTTIPFDYWARLHSYHHAHNGQLEVVHIGDIRTYTVNQYRELSKTKKTYYRLLRNPGILFTIGTIAYFIIIHFPATEMPVKNAQRRRKMKLKQLTNNIYLLAFYLVVILLIGWQKFLLVHIPIFLFYGTFSLWFFYVQHQHEETYKKWQKDWDYLLSAIKGSTFYKLPKVFQWLSGNIGFHHIHHLSPKIPNYHLEKCAKENPILTKYVTTVSFWQSLKYMFHHLWDEETERMISFRTYYKMERAMARK